MENNISWVQMLPVLVGGALAIAGGVAGQFLTHLLDGLREKRQLQREKAEELVKGLYRHAAWLEEKYSCLFRQVSHDQPSPLDEACMLQKLYYPSMAVPLLAIMEAQIPLMKILGDQRLAQMKDLNTWIKAWDPALYYEAYEVYIKALDQAVMKMRLIVE